MPLSTPTAGRQSLHRRTIEMAGFVRPDGFYEIEGRLTDQRDEPYENAWLGVLPPEALLHDMSARVVVDQDYAIHSIEVASDAHPYPGVCPAIAPQFQTLVGARLVGGWSKTLGQTVGGRQGCAHLVELLGRMATTALLTIYLHREKQNPAKDEANVKPPFIDRCHALASNGDIVRAAWPQHASEA